MSEEWPVLEGWESMQRQGQDIADRLGALAQGLSCMLHSHHAWSSDDSPAQSGEPPYRQGFRSDGISWTPRTARHRPSRVRLGGHSQRSSRASSAAEPIQGSSVGGGIYELGQRIGQAGADIGACVAGLVQCLVQNLPPLPFPPQEENPSPPPHRGYYADHGNEEDETGRTVTGKRRALVSYGQKIEVASQAQGQAQTQQDDDVDSQEAENGDLFSFFSKPQGNFHNQGSVSVTTTYDSRTQDVESSVVARGDLWRAEASHGGNASSSSSSSPSSATSGAASPLFLLQIGPILFVRDTTLLLPVHLSKHHLLWYGFDRKNGLHSLCPAVWSKHRRWLFMSMICLNPLACSFMDLQFPNGQFTYVAGEGITGSAFFSVFGGLLQAQGRHPGDTKLSFSRKTKWGTRLTPALQLSDKSVSLGVMQPLRWQRSGLIVRPTVQLSVTPTFGGRNSGWRAELIHSPKEKLSWSCGCSMSNIQPSAFASVLLGRSKKNGHSGSLGLVLQVETPLENLSRASFSIQLNSGVEF